MIKNVWIAKSVKLNLKLYCLSDRNIYITLLQATFNNIYKIILTRV